MKNYYDILGVSKNASKEEIKQAFRKLAIENHPDKGGNKEKFQEIQEAYEILSNEEKRDEYDNGPGISSFDFFFGNQRHNVSEIHKANHHYKCDITLRDVHFGITKKIKVKRENFCKNCYSNCDKCNGIGQISQMIRMGPFVQRITQNCNKCKGTGLHKIENCKKENCENGKIIEEKIFELDIPKGVNQNKQYIFSGWGEQSTRDNEISGDLIITINIEKNDIFERNDLNLIYEIPLTLTESIIGKDIKINIFDEIVNINTKIFGILNPNKLYIIYGKGLNSEIIENDKHKRGDLYIKVKIEYPEKTLNDNEINILKDAFRMINLT